MILRAKDSHEITREEKLLDWFQISRGTKLTTWRTICRINAGYIGNLQEVLKHLVDQGKVKKLNKGYKLVNNNVRIK